MSHPLDGARAKVANANRHLQELEAKIVASRYADTIGFAQQFHADTSTIEITLQGIPELPFAWSLMAADCVQNLRCALNYVAWELSRWNLARHGETREPKSVTQFPICTRAREFDVRRLPDVDAAHVARIKAIQPNGADCLAQLALSFGENYLREMPMEVLAKLHTLGVLVDLTNEDKHRVLPGVLVQPAHTAVADYIPIRDCEVKHVNHIIQGTLQNGAKWSELTVRATGPNPEVQVNDQITPVVQFGQYRVTMLPKIVSSVDQIVREFATDIP